MSFVAVAIGGASALNQYSQGQYAKAQGQLGAMQADHQASIEEANALKTAELIRLAGRRTMGSQRAAAAASGVVVGVGSPAELEAETTRAVESDAFAAILDGGRRARGMRTEGEMMRIDGKAKATAATASAFGTLASSAYSGARAQGWRTAGPGFSGTQSPAPVETR